MNAAGGNGCLGACGMRFPSRGDGPGVPAYTQRLAQGRQQPPAVRQEAGAPAASLNRRFGVSGGSATGRLQDAIFPRTAIIQFSLY